MHLKTECQHGHCGEFAHLIRRSPVRWPLYPAYAVVFAQTLLQYLHSPAISRGDSGTTSECEWSEWALTNMALVQLAACTLSFVASLLFTRPSGIKPKMQGDDATRLRHPISFVDTEWVE